MPQRDIFVTLSPEELARLKEIMRRLAISGKMHIRLRGNALLMSHKGKLISQIARELERSERTIYNWIRAYRRKGFASLDPRIYHRRLNNEHLRQLIKVSGWSALLADQKTYRERWTFKEMSEWVEKNWVIKISPRRLCQLFEELYRTKNFPFERDEKKHG